MSTLKDQVASAVHPHQQANTKEKPRTAGKLLFATGVTATAGFLYGYDTGIISGALLEIKNDFHLEHTMQEIVASAILVGAVLGALTCGWVFERFGRKHTMTLVGLVYVLGALASSLAPSAVLLALARVFLGFAVGGSSQTGPVYVAEIAPAERRGHFVTFFNVSIGLGIVAANLVSSGLHNHMGWRLMIAAAIAPAALLLICTFFLPESPRWLVGQGKRDEARKQLEKVRTDQSEIDDELQAIQKITDKEQSAPVKGWAGLGQKSVRPAVVAALGIAAFTQLTGIEMMIYYAPTLLTGIGFAREGALKTSLAMAVIYAIMTATGLLIVDRVGRRRLSLAMLPGAALSLLLFGCVFAFHLATRQNSWMVVACLLLFMFFNSGGIQVVGWLSGSEMYPLSVRGAGTSAQATMVWGSDLLVTSTALTLVHTLTAGGTMWVYAVMNVLAFWFILRKVPETAGRSLEDIETMLNEGNFHP